MFRRHTFTLCEKFFNTFLYDFLKVGAVAQRILENIELEQLGDILDTLLRIHHEHRNQKIHEALWYFPILVQLMRVRMVLEELCVSRLQNQVTEVAVSANSRVEWWCTERQHEE